MALPKNYKEVPFTNNSNHVLQPGDPAVAVTCSAGQVALVFGRYLGLRDRGVVMEVTRYRSKLVHKVTGDEYDHKLEDKELPYPESDPYNYTLPYNSDEYRVRQDAYSKRWNEWSAAQKIRRADYEFRQFSYNARTTLQLNKIYPGDIAVRDLVL